MRAASIAGDPTWKMTLPRNFAAKTYPSTPGLAEYSTGMRKMGVPSSYGGRLHVRDVNFGGSQGSAPDYYSYDKIDVCDVL